MLKHADHPWVGSPCTQRTRNPGRTPWRARWTNCCRELGPGTEPVRRRAGCRTRTHGSQYSSSTSPPRRAKDLRNAVAERFRQGLPFDAQDARIACQAQPGSQPVPVLAAAASAPAVLRCEEACEIVGLVPDYVGLATAAARSISFPIRR